MARVRWSSTAATLLDFGEAPGERRRAVALHPRHGLVRRAREQRVQFVRADRVESDLGLELAPGAGKHAMHEDAALHRIEPRVRRCGRLCVEAVQRERAERAGAA